MSVPITREVELELRAQVTALRATLADAVELCESLRSERDAQARLIARDTATIANLRRALEDVAEYWRICQEMRPQDQHGTEGERVRSHVRAALGQ